MIEAPPLKSEEDPVIEDKIIAPAPLMMENPIQMVEIQSQMREITTLIPQVSEPKDVEMENIATIEAPVAATETNS